MVLFGTAYAGTWAKIVVLEGRVRYLIPAPQTEEVARRHSAQVPPRDPLPGSGHRAPLRFGAFVWSASACGPRSAWPRHRKELAVHPVTHAKAWIS